MNKTFDFIKKAQKIHGEKYDYSKTYYDRCDEKISIICKKHGEFMMTPENHLSGQGCPKCSIDRRRKTNEEFKTEMLEKYDEKYDFSECSYINSRTKIKVRCFKHGEFWQYPRELSKGHACPFCSGYKDNTETFIEKFNKVFNGKYDTSNVKYIDSNTKVSIICHEKDILGNEHGEFLASPSNLLHGYGCPKCAKVYHKNTEEFVKMANFIHENNYDYSKTVFERANKKVEIICHCKDKNGKEHGSFWQTPNKHLYGQGCPKCGKLKKGRKKRTFESYVDEARSVHGNKYDYLFFEKYSSPAKMYCHEKDSEGNEHGVFWQLPSNHLKGKGCLKCRSSHLEERVRVFLEKNDIKYVKEWKDKWLRKGNFLPLDFYLPDYKIGIECQGKQHFEPVNFGGKMSLKEQLENFEKQKRNDIFKMEQCKLHGINLIYINYFDDNIENKLEFLLFS